MPLVLLSTANRFQFYLSAISTCKRLKLEVVVARGYTSTAIKFILHYVLVELEVVGVEKKITPTTASNLTLPEEAVRQKIRRLGLEVVERRKKLLVLLLLLSVWFCLLSCLVLKRRLRTLLKRKLRYSVVAKKLGVSEESARAKIRRLGLVVEEEQRKNTCSSSSELIMPEELISIEDALKSWWYP